MCLAGNEATIIAVLDQLQKARALRTHIHAAAKLGDTEIQVALSPEEALDVAENRVISLEARCRELGCHGPAPKADRGESTRIVSAK